MCNIMILSSLPFDMATKVEPNKAIVSFKGQCLFQDPTGTEAKA